MKGTNGGVIRVDDIEIKDVTSFFLRDLLNVVDVRDMGLLVTVRRIICRRLRRLMRQPTDGKFWCP